LRKGFVNVVKRLTVPLRKPNPCARNVFLLRKQEDGDFRPRHDAARLAASAETEPIFGIRFGATI